MVDLENALRSAISNIQNQPPVVVPLKKAGGKILAEKISSPVDIPNFTKATVDGYAVFSEDVKSKKAINELVGSVAAGDFPTMKLERGQTVEIQAEAPVPNGCDTVVEKCNARIIMNGARVGVLRRVKKGENIRLKGEVIKKGDVVLEKGNCLQPTQISRLSMLGIQSVKVFPTPRIGVFALGNEYNDWEHPVKPGQFWDANGPALCNSLYELGTQPDYLNNVEENPDAIIKMLASANQFGLVIMTGITDTRRKNLAVDALRKVNAQIIFDGVAVAPGSSTTLARLNHQLIFVLPHDPYEVMLIFEVLVVPVVRRMLGFKKLYSSTCEALLKKKIRNRSKKHLIIPANLIVENEKLLVDTLNSKNNFDLTSLSRANALICISKDVETIKSGKKVKVILNRYPAEFLSR